MLDHRPVGIRATRDDLFDTTVAVPKAERHVIGSGGVRAIDEHRALGPDDLEELPLRGVEGTFDRRREPVAPVQPAREGGVDTRLRQPRRCLDARGRGARRHEERRDTVDADIQQRPAAHLGPPAMIVRAIERAGEDSPGEPQGTQASGRDERLDGLRPGMERRHVGLEKRHAGDRARRHHRLRVGGRGRQRLFAEHVLAGGGGALHPLPVQAVRQRDVDRLDLGIIEQVGVATVGARGAETERGAGGRTLACHRDEPRSAGRGDRRQHRLLRVLRGGADDTPTEGRRRPHDQLASPSITTGAPPRVLDRCAASSTPMTRRTDAGVTASGSPRCRWSARFRWKAKGCSSAGGRRVSLIP